ncbi:hypothetical protein CLOSCI_00152 [[Clostridium] scindens ATCC 35704]|nr:hypothetical protein CLOSCI_00152 [[Clostridium] scindens ATCC 35704]
MYPTIPHIFSTPYLVFAQITIFFALSFCIVAKYRGYVNKSLEINEKIERSNLRSILRFIIAFNPNQ